MKQLNALALSLLSFGVFILAIALAEPRVVSTQPISATPKNATEREGLRLGNGDKFLFDLGSESAANIGCLNIPYDSLDKLFVSHLHSDHVGDMPNLWIGGWIGGRHGPLRVWGPSGLTADLGTKHFVESLKETFKWDYKSRLGVIPAEGGGLEVREFDYRQENKIMYEENGVVVRS